jgi:hypothetical protein
MKKFKALLSFDFDKTIVVSNYPDIVGLHPNAREVINRFIDVHDCCVIVNTCRDGEPLLEAVRFLQAEGVGFHHANEQHPSMHIIFGCDTRKISADVYTDDKDIHALCDPMFPNWLKLEQMILSVIYAPGFFSILDMEPMANIAEMTERSWKSLEQLLDENRNKNA